MSILNNKMLFNIFAAGLVLCSPLQAQPQPAPQWKTLTETKSGFSAMFPSEPEHIEQKIDIPKSDLSINYNTFISEPNENVVYVVSVWNYPAEIDMSKPEVNLQDGFGGMLSALPGSEVISMQMGEQQGFKSLEFLVKNDDIYFQGKLILVHNTLYQVFTVYKDKAMMTENYGRFIDSFKLINPDKQKVAPATNGKKTKKMNV
ncbi:MAG: hypothetical protein H7A36_07600 [Chlamydiales bacterium]|nr:hypothetical protein [Chlamydiales bacterium]